MSAYIVKHATVNRIVNFLASGEAKDARIGIKGLDFWNTDTTDAWDACEAFGKKLHAMNVAAIKARYGNDVKDMMPRTKYQFFFMPSGRKHQLLMSLNCFLYQCSEGSVPNRKLFKQLEQLARDVAMWIATTSPEYDACEWG
jgi:hypothetical protein